MAHNVRYERRCSCGQHWLKTGEPKHQLGRSIPPAVPPVKKRVRAAP